jgi:ADP-ribosyl-[dinitrogen reductase] hydrolase
LNDAQRVLATWDHHHDTLTAVEAARDLAATGPPSPEDLESLGGGWVGEEALSIAIACAASATSFTDAVLRAVNHSGDSDSTGSITGNLLGAAMGASTFPEPWLAQVELRGVIEMLAADATREFHGDAPCDEYGGATPEWFERYPGW